MMLTTQAETEYAKGDGVSIASQVTGDGPLDLGPSWVSPLKYTWDDPSPVLASMAAAGEVLVSSTVKDLVAGSGLQFEDRGAHVKGVPGERRLFAVTTDDGRRALTR